MSIYDGKIEPLPTQKKTLTEQWKDGELPLNHYYIKTKSGIFGIDNTVLWFDEDDIPRTKLCHSDMIEEVVATVPTYDEYKKLKKQLDEANMVIKRELKRQSPKGGVLLGDMNDYFKRWGLKWK